MPTVLRTALGLVLWLGLGGSSAAEAGSVGHLLVEYRANPLGLDVTTPRFSWMIQDGDRDERQTAYRVLVASSVALLDQDTGDLWDSGKVASNRSTNVTYAGSPLAAHTRCWWKVRVWDAEDVATPYSERATFTMGLLSGSAASYLWDGTWNDNDYCYLRRSFQLGQPVARAYAYVTAHDDYRLFVNGTLVGKGPAQNDPYAPGLYNTYDVSGLLVPGENVLAAIGHYHGLGVSCGVRGQPAFLAHLEVRFTDETSLRVLSDGSWRVQATTPWDEASPVRGPSFAQATSAEHYDARLEIPGWNQVGFDDSGWPAASVVTPGYALRSQLFPAETTAEILDAVSVDEFTPGVQLVDFGRNSSGWPILTIRDATPGDEVTVWYSEELEPGGTAIVRDRDRIDNYHDRYTCKGGGIEAWEPDVRYNGFRWMEVEGYPGALAPDDVQLRRVHGRLDAVEDFACSNQLLDDVYRISVRTQENAVQGVLVDCPQRELTQYLADTVFQGVNLAYNVRDFGLLRKPIRDFVDSERELYAGFPVGGYFLGAYPGELVQFIPEWTFHFPLAVWLEYWLWGDEAILDETYPVLFEMATYFDRFRDPSTGLLTRVPATQYISDWPQSPMDTSCPSLTPQNCLYYGALRRTAEIAEILGRPADAALLEGIADELRAGINTHLFDGVDRYADCLGSAERHQVASLFALYFDVVPQGRRAAVFDYVTSLGFEARVYGGWYLTQYLLREDEMELLYGLIDQTQSLWGAMVASGATTTWEDWTRSYGSLSHAWSAYPCAFLKSGLLGIEPTSPGFATFRVRPRPVPDLTFAEGGVPTVRGDVHVRWEQEGDELRLTVDVPVNTTARVDVPRGAVPRLEITESGAPIWSDGRYVGTAGTPGPAGTEERYVSFIVGSGTYAFVRRPLQRVQPLGALRERRRGARL